MVIHGLHPEVSHFLRHQPAQLQIQMFLLAFIFQTSYYATGKLNKQWAVTWLNLKDTNLICTDSKQWMTDKSEHLTLNHSHSLNKRPFHMHFCLRFKSRHQASIWNGEKEKRVCTKTRFETEAKGNSKIANPPKSNNLANTLSSCLRESGSSHIFVSSVYLVYWRKFNEFGEPAWRHNFINSPLACESHQM